MSGFLSKTLCLGIGAALGAGITYLAMKDDFAPMSDHVGEVSDTGEVDYLMEGDIEVHQSADAGADENPLIV